MIDSIYPDAHLPRPRHNKPRCTSAQTRQAQMPICSDSIGPDAHLPRPRLNMPRCQFAQTQTDLTSGHLAGHLGIWAFRLSGHLAGHLGISFVWASRWASGHFVCLGISLGIWAFRLSGHLAGHLGISFAWASGKILKFSPKICKNFPKFTKISQKF